MELPLHGARAEVHDWVAGAPGDFTRALDALHAARSLGLELGAWTLLTRSNARVIGELPSLLRARGVRRWVVVVPRAEAAPDPFTRVVPRLGLAIPAALAAIEAARGRGVEAWIEGAPRCLLGPLADRAVESAPRAFAPVCAGCRARAACPGVDGAYLARFGAAELRAVAR